MNKKSKDDRDLAIHAFSKINVELLDAESLNLFQSWIDEYVDAPTWSRCYRALNQKHYLNNNKQHAITITHEAYVGLKNRAKQYEMSLSEAIMQLLNKEDKVSKSIDELKDPVKLEFPQEKSKNNVLYLVPKLKENKEEEGSLNVSVSNDLNFKEEEDALDFFDLFHTRVEQPHKPKGYDFRQNETYKNYRQRINRVTIKKQDEGLLEYFNKHCHGYLTEDNCTTVGKQLITMRASLLDDKHFSNEFKPECFAISKGITVSNAYTESYADELAILLCDFLGCTTRAVTSGKREPFVFAGNKNHVQIAFKAFHFFNAFLSDELEQYSLRCHKNTKPKNRRRKAESHASRLLYRMFDSLFIEDEFLKNYSEDEEKKLSEYCFKNIGLYFDENEPIGGWYKPQKKKRNEDIFLW